MRTLWVIAGGLTLLAGCATTHPPGPGSSESSFTRGQLVVQGDFPLPRQHRIFDDLEALRDDIANQLQLPKSEEPIYIRLFQSHESYRDYLDGRYPAFPQRRACFVESDTRLSVYAHWGDRVAEDLRHETSHGYLHAVVRNLPLWLDEGLAEYFEVPRGRGGLNGPHVELLRQMYRQGDWRPDLRRLEQLEVAEEMAQLHYAESWAWIHFMLESSAARKELLEQHLTRLRVTGAAPTLFSVLAENETDAHAAMIGHLLSLPTR